MNIYFGLFINKHVYRVELPAKAQYYYYCYCCYLKYQSKLNYNQT